jgi:membrane protein implicated in regulation of membrane protease activity
VLFGRRVAFAIVVLAAQLLLIALAIAWCVHMVLIAKYGQIFFVEENPMVLYGEIAATVVIILFGLVVFALQCKRLGERRRGDDRERGKQG